MEKSEKRRKFTSKWQKKKRFVEKTFNSRNNLIMIVIVLSLITLTIYNASFSADKTLEYKMLTASNLTRKFGNIFSESISSGINGITFVINKLTDKKNTSQKKESNQKEEITTNNDSSEESGKSTNEEVKQEENKLVENTKSNEEKTTVEKTNTTTTETTKVEKPTKTVEPTKPVEETTTTIETKPVENKPNNTISNIINNISNTISNVINNVLDDKINDNKEEIKVEELQLDEIVFTNSIILDKSSKLKEGKFVNGKINEDKSYISFNKLIKLDDNIKTLKLTTNNKIRIIIDEYDSNKKYIKSTNIGNLGYLYRNDSTKYITISFYEFNNVQVVKNDFISLIKLLDLNSIKIESIKDETLEELTSAQPKLVGEIESNDIINLANYRKGYYKSWGGAYEESTSGLASRNKYEVKQKKYYFNTNDSRFSISIQQYDENGKWIKYYGDIKNGETYTPTNEKVKYITIRPLISVWGIGLNDIWDKGLWVNFSTTNKEYKTEYITESKFDFDNVTSYKNGEYSTKTLDYAIGEKSIAASSYIILENNKTRRIRIKYSYASMYIIEMNKDGELIKSASYADGSKWTPDEKTYAIALTINNKNKLTSTQMLNLFNDESLQPSIKEATKYNYNKVMNNVTATELVNKMNVGWNLGDSLDSYYGTWDGKSANMSQETIWGNITVTEDLIDYVADSGFNTIRIPVSWYLHTYIDENGNYKVYDEWKDRVQDVVDYAVKKGMYVVMNTHCDAKYIILGQEDEKMKDVYKYASDLWTDIASYFKDYDEHLIFESYNEVSTKTWGFTYTETGMEQMAKINQIFVDAVRSTGGNNINRVLCIQTLSSMSGAEVFDNFVLPKDVVKNKIIIQVHCYDATFDQGVEVVFERIENFSKRIGAPVIIGEYNVKENSLTGEYKQIAISNFVARAKSHGIIVYFWDNGYRGDFFLFDRRDLKNSDTKSINAIMNPTKYYSNNVEIFDNMNKFTYSSLNQSTGELAEDKYWGTLVTKDINGHGIEIPKGTKLVNATLAVLNNAGSHRLHYIHFYDENMKLVKAYNSSFGSSSWLLAIPEGAKYMRVSFNSSFKPTGSLEYEKYLTFKELKLSVSFITNNSIVSGNGPYKDMTIKPITNDSNFFGVLETTNLNNINSWEIGDYNYSGGRKLESTSSIRIPKYLKLTNNGGSTYKYINNTWNAMRIRINEFNSDMKFLKSTTLTANHEIKLNADTKYISISIISPYQKVESTYQTYLKYFNNGMDMSFKRVE